MKKKHLLKSKGIPMFSYSGRHKTSHARERFARRVPFRVNLPSAKEIKAMIRRGSQLVEVGEGNIGKRKVIYLHNIGYQMVVDEEITTIISLMPIK